MHVPDSPVYAPAGLLGGSKLMKIQWLLDIIQTHIGYHIINDFSLWKTSSQEHKHYHKCIVEFYQWRKPEEREILDEEFAKRKEREICQNNL